MRIRRRSRLSKFERVAREVFELSCITHVFLKRISQTLENYENSSTLQHRYDPEDGTVEIAMAPLIQSGGKYDVRYSAQCDKSALSHDVIPLTVGCRYNLYCT